MSIANSRMVKVLTLTLMTVMLELTKARCLVQTAPCARCGGYSNCSDERSASSFVSVFSIASALNVDCCIEVLGYCFRPMEVTASTDLIQSGINGKMIASL